jgi:hypothetical protein
MENPLLNTDEAIEVLSEMRRHLPAFGDVDTGLFIGSAFDTRNPGIDRKRFITGLKHIADKKIEEDNNNKTFILCIDPNFPSQNIIDTINRGLTNIRVIEHRRISWEDTREVVPNNVVRSAEEAAAKEEEAAVGRGAAVRDAMERERVLEAAWKARREEEAAAWRAAMVAWEKASKEERFWFGKIEEEEKRGKPIAAWRAQEQWRAAREMMKRAEELVARYRKVGGARPEASGEGSSSHEESSSSAYNGIPNSTVQHVNNERESNENTNYRSINSLSNNRSSINTNRRNLIHPPPINNAPPVENTEDLLPLYLITVRVIKAGLPPKIMDFYVYFMRYEMETNYTSEYWERTNFRSRPSAITIQSSDRINFNTFADRCTYDLYQNTIGVFYYRLEELFKLPNVKSIYVNFTAHTHDTTFNIRDNGFYEFGKKIGENRFQSLLEIQDRYLQNLCEVNALMRNLAVHSKPVFFINIDTNFPVFKTNNNANRNNVHSVRISPRSRFYKNNARKGIRHWPITRNKTRINLSRVGGKRKGNERRKTRKSKK